MGFWDDFATGFRMVADPIYDHTVKPAFNLIDRASGAAGNVITGAGNIAQGAGNAALGLGDFLGGNSNFLLYAGLGLVAVLVVPKLIDKIL
jgi:hypothetical protein